MQIMPEEEGKTSRVQSHHAVFEEKQQEYQKPLCNLFHEMPSRLRVHDAAYAKRRYDATHARGGADEPVRSHDLPTLTPSTVRAVIHVQAEQMYRRREELDRGRGDKLRRRQTRDVAPHLIREPVVHPRRQQRRQIERSKDGQAITHSKKEITRQRDGSGYRAGRPEEAHKDLVLVHA